MRENIRYTSLKSKKRITILAHSLVSKTFIRKYGILCVILCLGLGYLYYRRVLHQKYIYHTLPAYQQNINLKLSPKAPRDRYQTERWQPIGDPSKRFQIYSAYFDSRLEIVEDMVVPQGVLPFGSVRIVAILPLKFRQSKVFCHFRYRDQSEVQRLQADRVETIHENFDMPFSATFVVCKLVGRVDSTDVLLPDEVGLSYEVETDMTEPSFVEIHYPTWNLLPQGEHNHNLAVCVGPLHHNFTNAARIVEFVEYWKLLGAERFYFYNKTSSDDVSKVLRYFDERGEVEVHDWNLEGYEFEQDLRYEGIFAALNDCLYRATVLGEYSYTALVDLDEFLMPAEAPGGLIRFLTARDRYDVHSFNFQAVFFYDFYEEDFSRKPTWTNNSYLYTQVRNQRTSEPFVLHNRSKYIAKGRCVIEAGNHFVWRALRDTEEYHVREDEGLLFHYRDGCVGYGCESYVEDNRARRYENWIWPAVDTVCRSLFPEYGGDTTQ
ncbi:beta-1,4-galactosyltransferase galt-1 isoform X2 [Malaya genurostris]|uniref:beta-1,4-galactosyltransferase galt-1 isoform X2 n=1 Tax=Malaya genurostris TaxID=325434 RepID=UPI0026F38DA1|nr:beta-1,4-galactosyltransferase galt-1 isoform X2 [Malaya genurostris]